MSETNGFLTREELLGGYTPRVKVVKLSDGRSVRIRNLPSGQRDKYLLANRDLKTGGQSQKGLETAMSRLIQLCVVDSKDNRLFSKDDIPLLQEQDPETQDEIYAAAARHCGIIEDDEEAEKNE